MVSMQLVPLSSCAVVIMLILLASLDRSTCDTFGPKHGGPISDNTYGCDNAYDKECRFEEKVAPRHNFSPLDRITYGHDMVDYKRKILMSWTPKAGCTQAVLMFLDDMGFKEGVDFRGWPHDFRPAFAERCGRVSPCAYFDKDYYRFKIVRNPYDRAVSSFLHVMHSKIVPEHHLISSIPGIQRKGQITFKDFLTYIETNSKTPLAIDLKDGSHVRKQCYDFEYYGWLRGKHNYNRIVKLENFEADIAKVNEESGAHFKTNFTSQHYAKRVEENFYVGNISFEVMIKLHEIPKNYGLFYDNQDVDRVFRLFFPDILVYNYTYPYPRNPWMHD